MIEVNTTHIKLARWLKIAQAQRNRAAAKFLLEYGPESAANQEINGEIAELNVLIQELLQPRLPLKK